MFKTYVTQNSRSNNRSCYYFNRAILSTELLWGNSILKVCRTPLSRQVSDLANSTHIPYFLNLVLPTKKDDQFGANTGEAEEAQAEFSPDTSHSGNQILHHRCVMAYTDGAVQIIKQLSALGQSIGIDKRDCKCPFQAPTSTGISLGPYHRPIKIQILVCMHT